MRILPDPLSFEWDSGNSDKNFKKHKVTNREAEEVFTNKQSFIFEDQRHSAIETRYGMFGKTEQGRKLTIGFTIRGNAIRIITARDMSKKERRGYEKIEKNSSF